MEHLRNDHNQLTIFVDSDAFVALAVSKDASHKRAISLLQILMSRSVKFVTSNYVFAESITVISIRENHNAAVDFITNIQKPDNPVEIKRVDATLEQEAIEIFKRQTSKNISFVDCANMALMKNLKADAVFSFDGGYKKNKFILLEDFL